MMFLVSVCAILILFGLICPLIGVLLYPVYKFYGGEMNFKEYLKHM